MNILVVDDEKEIADLMELYLTNEGFTVYTCYTGLDALKALEAKKIDLALLDVMLPDMDGFSICRRIREGYRFPVIMLTAKVEELDKITGLSIGADDYITKPFVPMEVLARVRSQLRRYTRLGGQAPEKPSILTIGGICLDDEAKSVTVDGEPANLTPMEFAILRLLMSNPGKVYSSRSLYEAVWNEAPLGSEGAVAVHIRHLREKIEINPSDPRYLKVVWGQGYKMEGGKP